MYSYDRFWERMDSLASGQIVEALIERFGHGVAAALIGVAVALYFRRRQRGDAAVGVLVRGGLLALAAVLFMPAALIWSLPTYECVYFRDHVLGLVVKVELASLILQWVLAVSIVYIAKGYRLLFLLGCSGALILGIWIFIRIVFRAIFGHCLE